MIPVRMPMGCTRCPLSIARNNIVIARGQPDAEVLFVGEAPGADEDRIGLPFVGRSGKLLDEWISILELGNNFEITNICRCRPPGNRTPTPEEQDTCGAHLLYFLKERPTQPKIIVALGRTADRWLERQKIPHVFMKHPSYYLRGNRWEDDLLVLKDKVHAALKCN